MAESVSKVGAIPKPSDQDRSADGETGRGREVHASLERSVALVPGAAPQSSPETAASETVLSGASAFAAQVMGQKGRKRGLKGGAPVLDEAKSAYLETEWSGKSDRRIKTGRITRTEV